MSSLVGGNEEDQINTTLTPSVPANGERNTSSTGNEHQNSTTPSVPATEGNTSTGNYEHQNFTTPSILANAGASTEIVEEENATMPPVPANKQINIPPPVPANEQGTRTPQPDPRDDENAEKMRHLEKEAFQLANYYFVFQGVIFTAFYHVPHFKCKYLWVPLALSVIAGAINIFAVARIGWRYMKILNYIDRNRYVNNEGYVPIVVCCLRYERLAYFMVFLLLIVAFLGVTIAGCVVTTCHDHNTKTSVLKLRT